MRYIKATGFFLALIMLIATIPLAGGNAINNEKLETVVYEAKTDITIGNCYTTDWVNGWQDTGLRIKEWPIDGEVYAYAEVYADNLQGHTITHVWWYDNGTGLENKWQWNWVIPEPWTSAWCYTYWDIGLDYGKGWGYIEILADGESIGASNNYAMDNSQPNKPEITGPTEGTAGEPTDYTFSAVDPDGFDMFYIINWGDGSEEETLGPYTSGYELTKTHTYAEEGDYVISCKAKDLVDNESELATLEITMPKSKSISFNNIIARLLERCQNVITWLNQFLKS